MSQSPAPESFRFPTATVTLWCVSSAHPEQVLATSPSADRGFGRKFLAQLNPRWPITALGDFPLNRSTPAGPGEFYIAGFPGLAVIQCMPAQVPGYAYDAAHLSTLSEKWTQSIPCSDVFAFAYDEHSTLGGLAHWHGGELVRSFCATREKIFEDFGLPEPFESPYWAGERLDEPHRRMQLPFRPADMAREAERNWLGVDLTPSGMDVPVAGFAIDGRPEPKSVAHRASAGPGIQLNSDPQDDYDDYAPAPQVVVREWASMDRKDVAGFLRHRARRLGSALLAVARSASTIPTRIGDWVRAMARKSGRKK